MKHIYGAETQKLLDYAKEKEKELTESSKENLYLTIDSVTEYEAIQFIKLINREKIYTLEDIEKIFDLKKQYVRKSCSPKK